jgi:hypothetical protein
MKDMKLDGDQFLRAILLTHRAVCIYIIQYRSPLMYPSQNSWRIVGDIWAKWDFDRNDTLPAKIIRGSQHNSFVYKGTWEVYEKE